MTAGAVWAGSKTAVGDVGTLLLISWAVPAAIVLIGAPIALVIRGLLRIAGVQ